MSLYSQVPKTAKKILNTEEIYFVGPTLLKDREFSLQLVKKIYFSLSMLSAGCMNRETLGLEGPRQT